MNEDRLRRQLQAQAVVNRQLHAQLAEVRAELRAVQGNDANTVRVLWHRIESVLPRSVAAKVERRVRGALGTPIGPRPRPRSAARERASIAEWFDELSGAAPAERAPSLVQDEEGTLYLVEGTQRRHIPRMLVGALLAAEMGPPVSRPADEMADFDEGPPVEVFLAPSGLPFVIVGGRRRPINGFPLVHDVEDDQADRFEEGRPLRVGKLQQAVVARASEASQSSVLRRVRARWPG